MIYKSINLPYPYDDPKLDLSKTGETNPARQPSKSVETAAHRAVARTISKMQSRRNKPVIVTDFVRGNARETFDQMQVLRRSLEVTLGGKVGSVDDQSFALPVAERIPAPRTDTPWKMRTPRPWMS